jgi:hypothetical protein
LQYVKFIISELINVVNILIAEKKIVNESSFMNQFIYFLKSICIARKRKYWCLKPTIGHLCGQEKNGLKNMLEKDLNNEFNPLLGQIIRIDTEYHKLPLFGRLIAISEQFLTIERIDGRTTIIRRKAVLAVEPVKNQQTNRLAGGV